ncbi:TRAP transporter large permease [Halalkalibacter krulwichiae]|uniref:Sialic acid TRAP transporter permease protein SiaT n=1 Tax=Halalkalibacter krulwichiae TaxID=199441 RepID=A0A1X9M923_9BACI|nr:TRAP transporter large permease [Halalkalibacter krulwichiae]ARK29887.1 Sialic acid TRAP transporter permease protein SiaT [Halalkalibacter krulwichiae]
MTPIIIGFICIAIFFLFLVLRMPVSYAMLISGLIGISFINSTSVALRVAATEIYSSFSTYTLSAIPMFIWMGFLALYAGIGAKLFDFAHKMVGHLPGGLAIAAQGAAGLFGAISGSNTATAATIGSIAVPEMRKHGYNDSLSTASVAAGGILGVLIPPSTLFIIYGIAAEQSIGLLFLAGIIPGIILMFFFMVIIYIVTMRNPELAPRGEKSTWNERLQSLKGGLWEVGVIFALSMGGLFAGWFTPTEAGAVGAGGVLVLTLLTRKLTWEGLKNSLFDTLRTTAMIMLLIGSAVVFGRLIALSRIPFELGGWVESLVLPSFAIMALILLIYLILGFFMDALALILLTIPIFYPVVVNTLGYDPIWFGVIIVLVAAMGVITPPVGVNVFIIKGVVKDVTVEEIFRGIWPFLFMIILLIALLMVVPEIATFLPYLDFFN